MGQSLEGIAADNIWLEETGVNWCPDGNIADFDTDENGYTEFALAPCGGGCSENLTLRGFLTPGTPFNETNLALFRFNSPDISGDLVVNLIDLALFAPAFLGSDYCFDYNWDGVVNLVDLALFAPHFTHACAN